MNNVLTFKISLLHLVDYFRNELVTKSKFGSFVHLVQLEQLPSFLRTFVPQIELGDFGGFM